MTQQTWPDGRSFWQNKRVIVTGGAGFLGSFVVEALSERATTGHHPRP
jgi:GDP-L-fucose synthase